MNQMKIGKFIAECRKQKNLTQMQLAEKLNITDKAVSKWERGVAMPDSSIMLELCEILNITVNDLLCGEVVVMEKYNKEMEKNLLELTGDVIGENVDIVSKLADISSTENTNANPDMIVRTNLKVYLGTHVTLALEPLLRCVLVPNTFLTVKIDTSSQIYEVDGKINLKSGDIAYLNRNFYIREGSIKFNPQNIANPLLSIQAEIRERDSEGENVRIILSAQNQYLLDFNPKFSSIPIKSEREIRELLGQIVLADSQNVSDLIFAASDYYIQSAVGRSIENKLREILNFDILSIRTNVLQNAKQYGIMRKNVL